jgi:MFS family permease
MTIQDLSTPAVGVAAPARWPAAAVFLLNGLTMSTYLVRMPSLKAEHHLTDGQLGAIGMLFALAALACMQFVGPLVARVGSRPVLRASLAVMPVLLALLGLAGDLVTFAVLLTALGAVHGTTDAAMNAHAVTVERVGGRPLLNRCHAAWSVSAIVASLAAAGLAQAGVSLGRHLTGAGIVLLAGGLLLGPHLLPAAADRHTRPAATAGAGGGGRAGRRAGWTAALVALGLTGTALMVFEAAALGWGAIFLHDGKGASLGLAATAVTAYTVGQTLGRLAGDRVTLRFGAARAFRAGALVAAGGLGFVVAAPRPMWAAGGFAVMGLGTSVLLPLVFSAVGRLGGTTPAVVVSRMTTFTYAGILVGPAAIGWAAGLVGLSWTMAALVPVLVAVALLTRLPGGGRAAVSAG